MRPNRPMWSILVLAITLTLASALSAQPPTDVDSDWPCQQVLVPEVSAAVVWAGPSIEGVSWRDDPEIVALVERVTPASVAPEEAELAIAAFVRGLGPQERTRALTRLFAGVLETLNRDRRLLIDGIERYSRDQARRAEVLSGELDTLVRLERDPSAQSAAQARGLSSRLALEERIFDERERTIPYLCSRPVVVETHLGVLARMIAALMDA